jgi:hypothetical protein
MGKSKPELADAPASSKEHHRYLHCSAKLLAGEAQQIYSTQF